MGSDTAVFILAPAILIYVIAAMIYMIVQSRKLHAELLRSGQIVSSMPVIVTVQNMPMHTINHEDLRSPVTGLPPPPAYSTIQRYP